MKRIDPGQTRQTPELVTDSRPQNTPNAAALDRFEPHSQGNGNNPLFSPTTTAAAAAAASPPPQAQGGGSSLNVGPSGRRNIRRISSDTARRLAQGPGLTAIQDNHKQALLGKIEKSFWQTEPSAARIGEILTHPGLTPSERAWLLDRLALGAHSRKNMELRNKLMGARLAAERVYPNDFQRQLHAVLNARTQDLSDDDKFQVLSEALSQLGIKSTASLQEAAEILDLISKSTTAAPPSLTSAALNLDEIDNLATVLASSAAIDRDEFEDKLQQLLHKPDVGVRDKLNVLAEALDSLRMRNDPTHEWALTRLDQEIESLSSYTGR